MRELVQDLSKNCNFPAYSAFDGRLAVAIVNRWASKKSRMQASDVDLLLGSK